MTLNDTNSPEWVSNGLTKGAHGLTPNEAADSDGDHRGGSGRPYEGAGQACAKEGWEALGPALLPQRGQPEAAAPRFRVEGGGEADAPRLALLLLGLLRRLLLLLFGPLLCLLLLKLTATNVLVQ